MKTRLGDRRRPAPPVTSQRQRRGYPNARPRRPPAFSNQARRQDRRFGRRRGSAGSRRSRQAETGIPVGLVSKTPSARMHPPSCSATAAIANLPADDRSRHMSWSSINWRGPFINPGPRQRVFTPCFGVAVISIPPACSFLKHAPISQPFTQTSSKGEFTPSKYR